ncbi:MAG: NAD(P)/FAD-dependent oxidoreductase [Anaerolineae bacterium]
MSNRTAEVVICGAGIAGIAAAYHLSVNYGLKNIALVDERPPLSLTSDKSSECYRNWWPGPGDAMVGLMNRSIDILEEMARQSGNRINLSRRGYLYATADPARMAALTRIAEEAAQFGAGPVRYHTGAPGEAAYEPPSRRGFEDQPTGSDVFTDRALIQEQFPYLSDTTLGVVHARRCGWMSAYQYGMLMLEAARANGTQLVEGRVEGVQVEGGRVRGVRVAVAGREETIATGTFVNAAGPFAHLVARMVGVELPLFHERHLKVALKDHLGVIPRHAPMLIWMDAQYLPWTEEERAMLAESTETRHLLAEFPAQVHGRPEGEGDSPVLLALWTYDLDPVEPVFPLPVAPDYPEIVLRGMTTMLPGLRVYLDRMPKPFIDGGYYTKTRENRPLVGPLPVEGAYLIGALGGFGVMASAAAGELLAAHVAGGQLPPYAPAFDLRRYDDPAYRALLARWGESGQL